MARSERAQARAVEEQRETTAYPLTSGLEDRNSTSAAFIAAGIGVTTMGLLQFIAELNEPFNDALRFNEALGPYSGKYTISYLVWLFSWAILYPIARAGRISTRTSLIITAILVLIGAVILFPPFIGLFTPE
ncbi:MAG: hypothetical protein IBX64_06260 [Actinobacteria bacterium]|nr:hypothetical protein [Actinomycetota bacterium]